MPKHFGSTYAMVDFENKVASLYLSVSGKATSRLGVNGSVTFSQASAESDPVVMPDVTEQIEGNLTHQDFTFGNLHEYSNLDYSLLQTILGFEYLMGSGVTFSLDGEYVDLADDAGYVYGVESGSLFLIRSGFRFDF
ncbi:MAG: hypothetical protein AB1772_02540 [Candidatus Zixiibacteriota bacterium]